MQTETKQQIRLKVEEYITTKGSQNKAANSLISVSAALLSQIMNENWESISDAMWRNVASQVGFNEKEHWPIIETTDFKIISHILNDAQQNANVFAMVGSAGSGKSKTLEHYASENKNAFLISCNEYWNRKYFLAELLRVMGRDFSGLTVAEMMYEAVKQLKTRSTPLIILDEADKLSDQVLYFFITLYNALEDRCGIVLIATDHLDKRLQKGIKLNKKGYNEIYSRIGRKCIELKGISYTDVVGICTVNNITDKKTIKEIWDDCEGDLRRIKRKIHALKQKENGA